MCGSLRIPPKKNNVYRQLSLQLFALAQYFIALKWGVHIIPAPLAPVLLTFSFVIVIRFFVIGVVFFVFGSAVFVFVIILSVIALGVRGIVVLHL